MNEQFDFLLDIDNLNNKVLGETKVANLLTTFEGLSKVLVRMPANIIIEKSALYDEATVKYIEIEVIRLISRNIDDVIVNGDLSKQHQDADVSLGDHRCQLDGFRRLTNYGFCSRDGYHFDTLLIALESLKSSNTLILCSPSGFASIDGLNLNSFSDIDARVVITSCIRDDLNRDGVYVGHPANLHTIVQCVNADSFGINDIQLLDINTNNKAERISVKFLVQFAAYGFNESSAPSLSQIYGIKFFS